MSEAKAKSRVLNDVTEAMALRIKRTRAKASREMREQARHDRPARNDNSVYAGLGKFCETAHERDGREVMSGADPAAAFFRPEASISRVPADQTTRTFLDSPLECFAENG